MLPGALSTRARSSETAYVYKGEQVGSQELRRRLNKDEIEKFRKENKELERRFRSGEFDGLPEILQNVWVPSSKDREIPTTVRRPFEVRLNSSSLPSTDKSTTFPVSQVSSAAKLASDSYYDLTRGRYEYLERWRNSNNFAKGETVLSMTQKLRVEALEIGFYSLLVSTAITGVFGGVLFLYLRSEERRERIKDKTQRFSEALKRSLNIPITFISSKASHMFGGVREDSAIRRVVDSILSVDDDDLNNGKDRK
eukprot:jgi/Galph1/448/GphlegSOOS_G5226.1